MKRCAKCKALKTLDAFGRNAQSRDGHGTYCRDRYREMHRTYRAQQALRDGRKVRQQRERVAGMKWCPDCQAHLDASAFGQNKTARDGLAGYCRPHQNARVAASLERLHGGGRQYHLIRRYGVSAADVDHMVEQQQGLCPVCERDLGEKPHVDHDHATGEVRQVLCFTCNGGLGLFGDDPARLRAAAAYVERHRGEDEHRGVKTPPVHWPSITLSVAPPGEALSYLSPHRAAR